MRTTVARPFAALAGLALLASASAARAQSRDGPFTPWEDAAAAALGVACETAPTRANPYCAQQDALLQLDPALRPAALLSLSGKEISARKAVLLEIANGQQAFVGGRLAALRGSRRALSVLGAEKPAGGAFAAAAPDAGFDRAGAYATGQFGFGSRDESAREAGYGFDRMGGVWGADVRAGRSLVVGAAGGFARHRLAFDRTDGRLTADAYSASAYAAAYPTEALRAEGVATYGWTGYETLRRAIALGPPGTLRARGDSGGRYVALSAGVGWDLALGGLLLGPYARADYLDAALGSYAERGAGALGLRVSGRGVHSLKSALGLEASYAASASFGVILPHLRLDWRHEFQDGRRAAKAAFADAGIAPGAAIQVQIDGPDRDFLTLGAGVSAVLAGGVSLFADYEPVLGLRRTASHGFAGGVRMEF